MAKENYLFFAENALGASATAYVAKASNFLGADASASTKVKLSFKALAGTAADDIVELTFTPAGAHIEVMHAVAGAGEEVEITDLPVLWRATGMNFRPINEAITSVKGQDKMILNTNLLLSTARKKHGSNVYYMTDISIDKDHVEFSKKDYETIEMFNQLISQENIEVSDGWKSAQQNKIHDADTAKVINEVDSPEKAFAS